MFSGITTGVMNGLKRFCGIYNLVPKSDIHHCNIVDQNSHTKNLNQFLRKHKYIVEQNLEDTNNNMNYVGQKVQATENDDLTNPWENLINNFRKYIIINYFS